MRKQLKATVAKDTITLVYNKQMVVVKKNKHPKEFENLKPLLKTRKGIKEVKEKFTEWLELMSIGDSEHVEVSKDYLNNIKLKNTKNYLPADVLKKLTELDLKRDDSLLPILKFWYKLDENPSKNSREQLYRFITSNNIPITEDGDIVMEKGIKENRDGVLVDVYSERVDNSIGRVITMDRNKVEDNPNKTCSAGLHCAPPDYVRQWYSDKVIVKVLVNPVDVVSVPVDYDSRKVRVCKYQVIGFSSKSTKPLQGGQIVNLQDLISEKIYEKVEKNVIQSDNKITGVTEEFEKMSGREIIEYVKEKYDVEITLSVKNKKGIVKKAYQIAQESKVTEKLTSEKLTSEVEVKEINLPKTNTQLVAVAKSKLNESISRVDGKKANKNQLVESFKRIFSGAGFKIIE